jgi:pullulanase
MHLNHFEKTSQENSMYHKKLFQWCLTILVLCGTLISPIWNSPVRALDDSAPNSVTIAGTMQSELGCSGDWMPGCAATDLTYDSNSDVWKGTFNVTPGNDQDKKGPRYKVALNGNWDVNYGLHASQGGADIPLVVDAPIDVSFYYDNKSHLVSDDYNTPIIVALGNFQTQLGCSANDDPACLRSWLEDPEGDGNYAFVTSALKAGEYSVSLSINQKKVTSTTDPQTFIVAKDNDEIYFGYDMVKKELILSTTGAPKGSLAKQKAIWVNKDTLVWDVVGSPRYTYALYYSPEATMELTAEGISGGKEIPLTYSNAGPGGDVFEKHPYLAGFSAFKIGESDFSNIIEAVRSQLAVVARDDKGNVVDATSVQTAGVLDAMHAYSGPLGVSVDNGIPTLRVWAPSAITVQLVLFTTAIIAEGQTLPMIRDDATGVWSLTGDASWMNQYYLFKVEVYVPKTGKIETNLVTDPYSVSLSMNSLRSQIVDLENTALKPEGWDKLSKPPLAAPEDGVIYELHVRDFSIKDTTVPENLRGTFLAFTVKDSLGMQHLASLAKSGLTTIHLLPAFDIASVDEDKSTWATVDEKKLASYPPDSDQQAQAVSLIKGSDGFNWGYDPYHFTTPEGSYSTDPQGSGRILEFRQMVQALNTIGLRVVMDVVYNHTAQSGQDPKSVLDKIVPGYYYRLDTDGNVTTSTCCQNTATENRMMEKLMVDSVVTWAKEYKVDGFRFDLMGHHMLSNMQAVRTALDNLTLKKDGVDGKAIYIYGEGWDFGEVANNNRGVNASQLNIGGTGIGVFNDRLRDGVRGGNPFEDLRMQGFSTGLYFDPNQTESRTADQQLSQLLDYTDWIRIGMAGNLKDYQLIRSDGQKVDAAHILYGGKPAGYTLDPQENVIYVSAHDNHTIFDAVQLKAPASASLVERIRMNNLALSIPMLSQGVPFFHAGDDILRSKSLDGNSYDSGDWYNANDWSYASNDWGIGLPIEGSSNWEIFKPLLANAALKPQSADLANSSAIFNEFLRIRKSSPLFRLQTADEVMRMVSFLNNGPSATPGLIVMRLQDADNLDPKYNEIVVLVNADHKTIQFSDTSLSGKAYMLHPVLQNSTDSVVRGATYEPTNGMFTIPALTTAVFVLEQPALQLSQPVRVILTTIVILLIAGFTYLLTSTFLRKTRTGK